MVVKDPYYGKSNFVYECVQGDSVKEISKNYLLSIKEIKKTNNLNGDISSGDKIIICKKNVKIYRVLGGDSAKSISQKFGISVEELKKNTSCEVFYPGQIIYVNIL